ncbi:peptide-methionine (S)-S-oxide reductase MsrA [Cyanobium sp. Morenito 9A2]|uniref:peptide-methionine (S)-S-oxide reductase MsrA n=1 Tax=Cyanobium sp. Morenito 9A2 TaxID=2823718 RepID=UPI0020CF5C54|nr:peptide-methionine (S)-S-oxide reductase MsrA [Cyanobium sp. Morenito 9A2]MCP9849078.1 peptide-methionine (S)-S-oxide reductase MsrA [Cyanobium sp. Morenito 9A2]
MGRSAAILRPLALALVLLLALAAPAQAAIEEAIFAGGCFWCLEHDLEGLPGVLEVVSGYSGGAGARPSYAQVSAGGTGHQESVKVRFDGARLSYPTLLRSYWRHVDALDGGGQFCDRGDSYRPVIFTQGPKQAKEARASQVAAGRELQRSPAALKVQIRSSAPFWPAEAYHQNFAERNALKYNYYRWSCGRDRRLDQLWGRRARRSDPWGSGLR